MKRWIFLLTLSALCTGCYPMPDEDYCSTVPMTNNPHVVPQKKASAMPSIQY